MGDVVVRGHLGHNDHEMLVFTVRCEIRRSTHRTSSLDPQQADCGLVRTIDSALWESVLKAKEFRKAGYTSK